MCHNFYRMFHLKNHPTKNFIDLFHPIIDIETGINGVLELQWLATVHQYNIASVQHLRVDNLDTLNVTQQLHNIKSSMVQIIVLNCNYRVANVVFRQVCISFYSIVITSV